MVELNPQITASRLCWFAVQTYPGLKRSFVVSCKRNVEHFLLTIKRFNHWTDRKKEVEIPLFAGYCFARLTWEDRLSVLQSQGVVRPVGCMGSPVARESHPSLGGC